MSSLAPQRHDALVVRRARPADAAEIARVQVQSWREAYTDIIPQAYLDQLSVPSHERQWRRTPRQRHLGIRRRVERKLVGFASGGLSRVRRDITGEIRRPLRAARLPGPRDRPRLFDACHYELARCGHHGLLVWVLADNRSRGFYEHLGGLLAGSTTSSSAAPG